MNQQQTDWLIEAMYHLEVLEVQTMRGLEEAEDRASAAHYLVQRALNGHVPPNWDEVLDKVRAIDALDTLAEIQEQSKASAAPHPKEK